MFTVLVLITFAIQDDSSHMVSAIEDPGKCYGDLGCFSITGEYFHPIYRPITVYPEDPSKINTGFFLYTRRNPKNEQYISRHDPKTISESNLDSKNQIKIICHGFSSNINTSNWIKPMKDELLAIGNFNVILVDWNGGNQLPYEQATANTRLVGREIGNLLKLLQLQFNVTLEEVHFIGHSLGAHIGGYVGQWLNQTILGRISGMDPAGPYFQYMPKNVTLSPDDALFVDVIHTSGGSIPQTSLGLLEPLGHVDFYPDGGEDANSCNLENEIKVTLQNSSLGYIVSCNHEKSIQFYRESINGTCSFTSYACEDIDSYRNAKCYTCNQIGHDCRKMGYYSDQYDRTGLVNAKFFLTSSDKQDPLCLYHWVMEIKIAEEQKEENGKFNASISGENSNITNRQLYENSMKIEANTSYYFLIEFYEDPVSITRIDFSWIQTLFSIPLTINTFDNAQISVKYIKLIPIDTIDQMNERQTKAASFCNANLTNLKSEDHIILTPSQNCE